MPMVWYVPPLSPVVDALTGTGHDGEDAASLFGAIDSLRIPIQYLAELFTAGDPAPVEAAAGRLAAMRTYMRGINLGRDARRVIAAAVGMTGEQVKDMYRLLALAKYEERYVIPTATPSRPTARGAGHDAPWTTRAARGWAARGPFGESSGGATPIAVENFHMLKQRQTADTSSTRGQQRRVNLLNWDGKGAPQGLFPPASAREPNVMTAVRAAHAAPTRAQARAAGVSRCCSPTRPTTARQLPICAPPSAASRTGGGPLGAVRRPRGSGRRRRPAADYVETFDLRRRCALPHLLHPRRHPQARRWPCCASRPRYRRAGVELGSR